MTKEDLKAERAMAQRSISSDEEVYGQVYNAAHLLTDLKYDFKELFLEFDALFVEIKAMFDKNNTSHGRENEENSYQSQ
jgi:hypothetical protein